MPANTCDHQGALDYQLAFSFDVIQEVQGVREVREVREVHEVHEVADLIRDVAR